MIRKNEKTSRTSDPSRPHSQKNLAVVLALLDKWLQDESGYDEETWPELKVALDRERLP